MTLPSLIRDHKHISEREIAHRWPHGQFDDFRWEDCTWCSGLMMARLCHSLGLPPTHVEAEALRETAGEDPLGGSGNDDLLRGFIRRYSYRPTAGKGAANLWKALEPGMAAAVQGRMGVFPAGHPIRRWSPHFTGAHQVLVVRINNWDRVWWDDPMGPETGYEGEYVSKANLLRFMNGLPFTPSFLIDSVRPHPVPPPPPAPPPGVRRARISQGSWWDYRVGNPAGPDYRISRVSRFTDGFTASAPGKVIETVWAEGERRLVKLTDGAYAGRWVDLNDAGSVTELKP